MNRSKLLIYATVSAFVCILILSVILIYQSSKPSKSTFSQQQENNEQTTDLLSEVGANINTHGLVVYQENGFGVDTLVFELGEEPILVTVINKSPDSKVFYFDQKPEKTNLPDQISLSYNQFEELLLSDLGMYTLKVQDTEEEFNIAVL